jgi:hypothetical protein
MGWNHWTDACITPSSPWLSGPPLRASGALLCAVGAPPDKMGGTPGWWSWAPAPSSGAPVPSSGAPGRWNSAPAPSSGAPGRCYCAPAASSGAPGRCYCAPAASSGAPLRNGGSVFTRKSLVSDPKARPGGASLSDTTAITAPRDELATQQADNRVKGLGASSTRPKSPARHAER